MSDLKNNISWVILAGGNSSRMSGKDKGLIEVFDKPLIEYTINVLKKTGAEIAINANRNQNSYAMYGDVFGDTVDERLGPLLGILTSLQYMQTEYVGFVPCDAPMLSLEFIQHLTSRSANSTLTVASDGQFIQPTFSVFHKSMLTPLESFLFSGGRKAGLFMTQQNADVVDCEIYQQCFTNLNTPLDVEQFISTINHSN